MSKIPAWKRALEEPNAAGWIAFFVLVVVIGFAALYFDGDGEKRAEAPTIADGAGR